MAVYNYTHTTALSLTGGMQRILNLHSLTHSLTLSLSLACPPRGFELGREPEPGGTPGDGLGDGMVFPCHLNQKAPDPRVGVAVLTLVPRANS